MRVNVEPFDPGSRWSIRLGLCACWAGLVLLAALFTLVLYAFQGFSPDGPPPGFKPEPIGWFFLKYFPLIFVGSAVHYWWLSAPLLALTGLQIRRFRATYPKPRRASAYDLD
jgi:hypothetical protein